MLLDDQEDAVRNAVRERVRKAEDHRRARRPAEPPALLASSAVLGRTYGVGIGLYFSTLRWLQWMLVGLALSSAAYVAMVNCGTWSTSTMPSLPWYGASPTNWASLQLQRFTFAMLMDDKVDMGELDVLRVPSGVAQHVNAFPRKSFLQGIAAADAVSMALCLGCLYILKLAGRYVADEQESSLLRVSDFTVLVQGLPDVTAVDVGEHFSQWGEVMDVVVVKDCGALTRLAAEVSRRDAKRRTAREVLDRQAGRAHESAAIKADRKLEDILMVAVDQLSSSKAAGNRAVLVTFNRTEDQAACLSQCPSSWLGSFIQKRSQRLGQQHRFWAQPAHPPEDYMFDNMNNSWLGCLCRMVTVRLLLLACLLLSCLVVTKLVSISNEAANNIRWDAAALQRNISRAMLSHPANGMTTQPLDSAINAAVFASSGSAGDSSAWGPFRAISAAAYCTNHLPGTCQAALNNPYIMNGVGPITLRLGQPMNWSQPRDRFLVDPDPVNLLRTCQPGTLNCTVAMCLPCYCAGLQATSAQHMLDADWVQLARQQCGDYVRNGDAATALMRVVVALVIVVVNTTLRNLLTALVKWEQHWTHSGEEKAYAVLSFGSQLLNTVGVLLLSSMRLYGTGTNDTTKYWYQTIALSGVHRDFSPSWYQDVGFTLMVVIILGVVASVSSAAVVWAGLRLWRSCLVRHIRTAPQQSYNAAWAGPQFLLSTRIGNLLLVLTLVFTFSSGMPILYVLGFLSAIIHNLLDRWLLTRLCKMPRVYDAGLPGLALCVLPWAAAAHCAVGVWMHTYFNGGSAGGHDTFVAQQLGLAELSWADVWSRLTQLNGVPLLTVLAVLAATYLTHGFLTFSPVAMALRIISGCKISQSSSGSRPGDATSTSAAGGSSDGCDNNGSSKSSSMTYEQCVVGPCGQRMLLGTPTYQLIHHPRYKGPLNNPVFKPLYLQIVCAQQFTRLVAGSRGCFEVCPHVLLERVATTQGGRDLTPPSCAGYGTKMEESKKKPSTAPGGQGITVQVIAGEVDSTVNTPTALQHMRMTRSPFELDHEPVSSPGRSLSATGTALARPAMEGEAIHLHLLPVLSTASGQLVSLQDFIHSGAGLSCMPPGTGTAPHGAMLPAQPLLVHPYHQGLPMFTAAAAEQEGAAGAAELHGVAAAGPGCNYAGGHLMVDTREVQGGVACDAGHGFEDMGEEDLCFASYPSSPVARTGQPSFTLGHPMMMSGGGLLLQPSLNREYVAAAAAAAAAIGSASMGPSAATLTQQMDQTLGMPTHPGGAAQRPMSPAQPTGSPRLTASNLSRSSSMSLQHPPVAAAAAAATGGLSRGHSASGTSMRGAPTAGTPRSRVGAAAAATTGASGGGMGTQYCPAGQHCPQKQQLPRG